MPEVTVNGVTLNYIEKGDGAETVVFSHSYLVDHRHFEEQIDALAKRYRVLAFDHRGHGRSQVTRDGYDMENLYRDALAFVEATNAGPCHFIGLSTGGFVGLRLAIRRPDVLRSLVLMDTSADREPSFNVLKYNAMFLVIATLGFRPVMGAAVHAMFGPKFIEDATRRKDLTLWKERMRANDRAALIRFGRGIFSRQSVYDQLGHIRTPTLVVVGEHDRATPVSRAQRMANAIVGARLEVIPEGGHLCTVEESAVVTAVLAAFLKEQVEARHATRKEADFQVQPPSKSLC